MTILLPIKNKHSKQPIHIKYNRFAIQSINQIGTIDSSTLASQKPILSDICF